MTPSATSHAPVNVATASPDVYANCIALMIQFSEFGNRRAVNLDDEVIGEGEVDKDLLSLTKALIDRAALRGIKRIISNTRERLLTEAAVPSFASDGMYLLSVAGVERAETILTDASREMGRLVDAMLLDYPALVAQAKIRLGPMFREGDYPTVGALRAKFGVSWRYLSLGAPSQLQAVSGTFLAEQRRKIQAASTEAAAEIRNLYRASLLELTGHLVERLQPVEANGKKRRFHESALEQVTTFLDADPIRNVTNDTEIRAMSEKIRRILGGLDVEQIRTDDDLRARVAVDMEAVKAELDALVRSGRAMADLG